MMNFGRHQFFNSKFGAKLYFLQRKGMQSWLLIGKKGPLSIKRFFYAFWDFHPISQYSISAAF
jgi:hypothetical protein